MIFSLKKLTNITAEELDLQDEALKNKLFFHDLVNHTHGLLLFLNNQKSSNRPLPKDDLEILISEVKTLQGLIKNHYNYHHKNLHATEEWMAFSSAQGAFIHLVNLYLKNTSVSFSFEEGLQEKEIFFPVFYRIINNIVKNMAESKARTIEFKFSLEGDYLVMTSINEMNSFENKNHAEYLERVILSHESTKNEGLGLESVHALCQDHGGEFSFEINAHKWINQVKLPLQVRSHTSKAAA